MSGGGGGGSWTPDSDVQCSRLRFQTQIATPQPGAVLTLRVGDILDVTVINMGGALAVAVSKNGNVVGGLAGGLVNKLRECLLGGTNFRATVLTINGAQIMVEIEPI